jgi:uncharacterized lipoprotein YddW (UPF0748 family)
MTSLLLRRCRTRAALGLAATLLFVAAASWSQETHPTPPSDQEASSTRAPAPDFSGKSKGLWVDMVGNEVYNTDKAIDNFVANIGKAGFTDVYLIVMRGGEAMYPSRYVPASAAVRPELPDPPRVFIEKAKKFVHPWGQKGQPIRVHLAARPLEAYRGKSVVAAAPNHVLRQHPNWALASDGGGQRQPGDIFSLDPGVEEARAYCADLARELAQLYPEADGFQFMGLRYPGTDGRWGYGETSLAQFARDTKASSVPAPNNPSFQQWRRGRLTLLARQLVEAVKSVAPDKPVSFSCLALGPAPATEFDWEINQVREGALQDWVHWAREGIGDELALLNSFSEKFDPGVFDAWVEFAASAGLAGRLVIGLGQAENFAEDVLNQMRRGMESGARGVALYSYQEPNMENIRGPLFAALERGLFSGTAAASSARPTNIRVDPEYAHLEYRGPRVSESERPEFNGLAVSAREREAIAGESRAEQIERGELADEGAAGGNVKASQAPLLPDEIILKNEVSMKGRIVRETAGRVIIQLESGFEASVERSEIKEIRKAVR